MTGLHQTPSQVAPLSSRHELLLRLRSDDKFRADRVELLLSGLRQQPFYSGLQTGTVVVIDLLTGEHVLASSRLGGLGAFEKTFGVNETVGWLHEIGGGIVVGGGIGGQDTWER
jgi:hypothetical protein